MRHIFKLTRRNFGKEYSRNNTTLGYMTKSSKGWCLLPAMVLVVDMSAHVHQL